MTKQYTTAARVVPLGGAVLGAAVFGAVIGATAAAARGIRQVKNGEATRQEVAMDVARESGSTAVAAGAGVAVASALGLGPILSAVGVVAVAVGAKYALDSVLSPSRPKSAAVAAVPESAGAAAAKAAPQKAAPKTTAAKKSAAPKRTAKPAAQKKAAPGTKQETKKAQTPDKA